MDLRYQDSSSRPHSVPGNEAGLAPFYQVYECDPLTRMVHITYSWYLR